MAEPLSASRAMAEGEVAETCRRKGAKAQRRRGPADSEYYFAPMGLCASIWHSVTALSEQRVHRVGHKASSQRGIHGDLISRGADQTSREPSLTPAMIRSPSGEKAID